MPNCCYKSLDGKETECQFQQSKFVEIGGAYFCRYHLPFSSDDLLRRWKIRSEDHNRKLKSNWSSDERSNFTKEYHEFIRRGDNLAGLVAVGPVEIVSASEGLEWPDAFLPSSFKLTQSISSVNMRGANFGGSATFAARVQKSLDLSEACFFDRAEFRSIFSSARFDKCTFNKTADFRRAAFKGATSFADCDFHEGARFEDVNFGEAPTVSFDRVRFRGRAAFRAGEKPEIQRVFFRSAVFESLVGFEGREFKSSLIFRHALFHQAPRFQDAKISFESVFPGLDGFLDWREAPKDLSNQSTQLRREYFESASQAYRALRYAMKAQDAHDEEARFWELEMRTKERALTWSAAESIPKLLSKLYGWAARYGNSIARPLCWWVIVWAAFAYLIFAPLQLGAFDIIKMPLLQLADFSFQQTIRPFGVWSEEGRRTINAFLGGGALLTETRVLGVRILATIQSVVSLTLIALFGFAIRRRFRMA